MNTDKNQSGRGRHSIFYPYRQPLPALAPLVGDDTCGWRAERNLFKALNHLHLLRRKEELAERLAAHSVRTPPRTFETTYAVLAAHQHGELVTADAFARLARNAGLATHMAESLLREYLPVGHMEFHPSDMCNLRCRGCTYRQGEEDISPAQVHFPYDRLDRLADLRPRSILLSGGGEPTLYNVEGRRMDVLVRRLHEILPFALLVLITNGTHVPAGEWPQLFKWMRVSIDAATPETYSAFRRKPLFARVERNLLHYLRTSPVPVGGTFLYSRANIQEYVLFLRRFLDLVRREEPHSLPRFNLSFRPLRQNPTDTGRDFPEAISEEDIHETVGQLLRFAAESLDNARFLREQTNAEAVVGGNEQPAMPFRRCYYSQIFHIVRASCDIRPCFVRVLDPGFSMGNIITDSHMTISLRTLYIAAARSPHCDAFGCRQCHINHVLEQGLAGALQPPAGPPAADDPFF